MRTQGVVAFAVAGLLAIAAPAAAQAPLAGSWSVSFEVGLDNSYSGDLNNRSEGSLLDTDQVARPITISARKYANAYGRGLNWGVAIGRGLTDRQELRFRVGGINASGERKLTGRAGTGNINGSIFSDPDSYTEFGVDVGWRLYFRSGGVQPYLGGQVGFARVSAISAVFDVPDAVFGMQHTLALHSDSTAFSYGGSMGMLFNRSDRFGIFVNLDLRYRSNLTGNDANLTGTGLEDLNDKSWRWNMPLSVGIRMGF